MFTRHILMVESGELDTEFSRFYFFLPCITDSREEINQYMKCVNIHPFDLDEREFGDGFQPKIMTDYVVSVLKKIAEISNINLVKNADGLLIKRPTDCEIEWVDKKCSRITEEKLKYVILIFTLDYLPVEVWSIIVFYLWLIEIFNLSCSNYCYLLFFFHVCDLN